MVKTLRITTIITALLAAAFLVFPALFGARGGKAVEEFLKSPGAIEKFQLARGDKAGGEGQISPLVKQAQAFALYLNPPPPKQPAAPKPSKSQQAPRPKVTTPKFKLLGTSFYPLHPDLSLALIDEPGKGIRWVRQSERVGYLVIEQIKDGLVVIKDGGRTSEVAVVDRPKKINLVKSSTLDETGAETGLPLAEQDVEQFDEESARARAKDTAALEELIREMRAAQADEESGQAGPEHEKEDANAFEKFIESIRIGAEEAKNLNNLGKELQNGGTEPNDRITKIERRPPRQRGK